MVIVSNKSSTGCVEGNDPFDTNLSIGFAFESVAFCGAERRFVWVIVVVVFTTQFLPKKT